MRTKDMYLASLLVSSQCPIQDSFRDDIGQTWFEFGDEDCVDDLEQAFYENTAKVCIQDFITAQKRVKALIYRSRSNVNENGFGRRADKEICNT